MERVKSGGDNVIIVRNDNSTTEKLENTIDDVLEKDNEKLLEIALEKDVENCIKENEKYINAQRAYYNSEEYQTDL